MYTECIDAVQDCGNSSAYALQLPQTCNKLSMGPFCIDSLRLSGHSLAPSYRCHHSALTHWSWVMLICVSKLTIIGSDNGLPPGRCQAIIWTNAGILLIGPLGTNFSEILIKIHTFSFTKMHLKMSSGKWRPFCLGINVLSPQNVMPCCSISWWLSARLQHLHC